MATGYNQEGAAGRPKTLMGNWFEEVSKVEQGPQEGAGGLDKIDYLSTTNDAFSDPDAKRNEVGRVGPRQRMLEEQMRREAEELAKEVIEPPRPVRYQSTTGRAFGRKTGLIADDLLATDDWKAEQAAEPYHAETPITLYTSTAGIPGVTAATGKNPHARNATFSCPINEYGGATFKDL